MILYTLEATLILCSSQLLPTVPHENVVRDHVHELHVFQSVVGEIPLIPFCLSPDLGFQQLVPFVGSP